MQEPQVNDPRFIGRLMGILRQLENTTELNSKRAIIKQSCEAIPEFKQLLQLALDPYKKYGIQQFPSCPTASKITATTWYAIVEFLNNCRLIWSGDTRIEQLRNFMEKFSANDRDLLRRVVLKDLRCGTGASLVNSVFPGTIPEFGVMLADAVTEKHLARWQKNGDVLYGQAKENGDRLIVMISKDFNVESYSRNGHRLHNYREIESSLSVICQQSQVFKEMRGGAVFDGEVIMGDFWGTRSVKKLEGNSAKHAVYHVFDLVALFDWRKNESSTFRWRNQDLKKMSNEGMWQHYDNIEKVVTFKIEQPYTMARIDKYRDELVKIGKEGLMIRPDVEYNYKTRSSLFKHKKMQSGDFLIVEVLPGEEGKKHEHHAGAILVELEDGVLCKTGLKASNAQRDALWKNRAQIVGKVAEIAYQERTQNKNGKPKLQFPVFIKVREDKS